MKHNDEQVLNWKGIPVLTTRMLAERLGVQERNITDNFQNNKEWYKTEDYFLVKGSDLKALKNELHRFNRGSYRIEKNTRHAYLWRESGAYNQAKSADTPEAWEAFIYLKENYYLQREAIKALKEANDLQKNPLFIHTMRPVQLTNSKEANKKNFEEGGKKQTIEYNIKSCYLHSRMTTDEVKLFGMKMGLNKTTCKNAKEVLRKLKPEIAASMSITDQLRSYGAKLEEIAPLSVAAQPLLAKMYELGAIDHPKRLAS